jgi:D-alanyl-D-alanine carboxypeptidase
MRRIIIILLIPLILCLTVSGAGGPTVSAEAAVLLDASDGAVLFARGAGQRMQPASMTKIMTALVALENCRLDDVIKIKSSCTGIEGSSAYLQAGEIFTAEELLYALLLQSANDAAAALADHIGGFVGLMNEKAAALGMESTTFVTPNGYPPPYGSGKPYDVSTARDLVKLARALVKYSEVYRWTSAKTYTMKTVVNKQGQPVKFLNHNNILRMDKKKIVNAQGESEVDGLKTGYAEYCGSSIILTGKRNGRRAIVIVVGSETSKLRDEHARRLMVEALDAVSR